MSLKLKTARISPNIQDDRGFTLLELLISTAIILILVFLALMALSTFQRQVNIDSTSQEIMSILRLARSRTLGSEAETNYGVHFETSKYVLFSGSSYTAGAVDNKEYDLTDSEIYQINLTGGGSEVIFDRIRGTTSQSGDVRVRLVSDNNRTSIIKINPSGQISLNKTLSENGTRVVDSRHLHFALGWSIQNASTLTLAFADTTPVTQNIAMAGYFNPGKTIFDWSGTISVNGSDQVLRVHTHYLDGSDTNLSITRDRRFNNKALVVSIDGKSIVSYTVAGIATVGAFGGTMTVE